MSEKKSSEKAVVKRAAPSSPVEFYGQFGQKTIVVVAGKKKILDWENQETQTLYDQLYKIVEG